MATHDHTTRRKVLKALPAIGLAPATALALLAAPADTPILRLFERWLRMYLEIEAVENINDEDLTAACDRLHAIEDEMMALPSTCTAGLAAKITATSHGRDVSFEDQGGREIWPEIVDLLPAARALA